MSSYRGAGAAWDGGPPGAEADYAGQRAPVPAYVQSAQPNTMPTTDPWTGVSYSQYGATAGYDYQVYGAAASGYGYNYDANYYQHPDGSYYEKYPQTRSFPTQPQAAYEYPARYREKSRSPLDSQRYERQRSYQSKSRSASPYSRRARESSYKERRPRRSRSKSSARKKYSSSDRSSSRSRSYSHSSMKRDKKKRNSSVESSASDGSSRKKTRQNRGRDLTPPTKGSRSSSSRGRTPSLDRSASKSPLKSKTKHTKSHSSKDKRQREVFTPPVLKRSKMPEMIKSPADLKTAPFDPRFPNTNQTRYCYQSYLDFHRCQKVRGQNYEPCYYFQRVFKSICPNEWIDKWDTQRAEGRFPGRI